MRPIHIILEIIRYYFLHFTITVCHIGHASVVAYVGLTGHSHSTNLLTVLERMCTLCRRRKTVAGIFLYDYL